MKRLLRPALWTTLAVGGLACAVFVAIRYFEDWRLTRDFDSIVYSSRDGLCSVRASGDEPPFCPHVFLSHPQFSPNGRLIAADRSTGTKDNPGSVIVVANRRGAIVQRLAASEAFIRPAWGSDGKTVFAVSYWLPRAVARWSWPEGKKETVPILNLPDGPKHVQRISLSPSGRRAAVLWDNFDRIDVADAGTNAFTIRKALMLPFTYMSFPVWRDDDRLMLVARTERGQPAGLWEVTVETGEARKIEAAGLSLRDFAAISPDRRFAVVTARTLKGSDGWSLWRLDLGTGEVKKLTFGLEDVDPTWF